MMNPQTPAFLAALLAVPLCGQAVPAPENLAAGKPVRFLPAPDYALTAQGGTDAMDLTDGVLSDRKDNHLWFDRKAVGFSYPGLQQLCVDLGAEQPVGEVAIRFQGGSPQAGVSFPVWADLVASRDGKRFYKLAGFSRWTAGDRERFGVPPEAGKGWVHRLAFRKLNVFARFVGISFYGTGLNVSDELWVLAGPKTSKPLRGQSLALSPFCMDGAQIYFHKPVVHFATNLNAPTPVGLMCSFPQATRVSVRLELPPGVRLTAGRLGHAENSWLRPQPLADRYTRYTFTTNVVASTKSWGRLYLRGGWKEGDEGELRYQVSWEGGQAPAGVQRLRAVTIPDTPQPKRLLTGLGWWSLSETRLWPEVVDAFRGLGFSYVPVFARHVREDADWQLLERMRRQGFKVVNVDSPLHVMMERHKNDPELKCQLPTGPGKRLCPTYAGPAYREEIERLVRDTARAKPNLWTADIELWTWTGPTDSPKCSRCRADFEHSGCKDWKEWQVARGAEIWELMAGAVRKGARDGGGPVPECGGYDFRPGEPYQKFWSVDRLYPQWMHGSEVSTYSALEPHHIAFIGDEVRADRKLLKKSDVIPWLTPGDAGVFPGWAFRDALLECFANGARGLLFWSGRVWDTETLGAYAEAIRTIGLLEDVIVDGELLDGVTTDPLLRVSGVRKGDTMFLLVGDYAGKAVGKTVKVTVPVQQPSLVTDLALRLPAGRIAPGSETFSFLIKEPGGRGFMIQPRSGP
jgi:hypothetical protein